MYRFFLALLIMLLSTACGTANPAETTRASTLVSTPVSAPPTSPVPRAVPSAVPSPAPAEKRARSAPQEPARRVHVVQPGDTMWDIARSYGVELNVLIAANPGIRDPRLIRPGQEIVIPNP